MSLDDNLDDLRRHAEDFQAGTGFTFTVVDPVTGDVIGCVYLYPSPSPDAQVTVELVRKAGFACAVTTRFGVNTRETPVYELRRGGPWERDVATFSLKLAMYRAGCGS